MPIVLGVDVASMTGFCFGDSRCERPVFGSVKFTREGEASSMDGVAEAAARAMEWAIDITKVVRPEHVAIEAPVPERALGAHTNAWATALKFSLIGSIGAVCKMRGIPMRFLNIQAVRKHFIGHGNLPGELAKRETKRFCEAAGWAPKSGDEADAGAVWHHECTRVDPQGAAVISPIFLGIPPVQKPVKGERVSLAPKRFGEVGMSSAARRIDSPEPDSAIAASLPKMTTSQMADLMEDLFFRASTITDGRLVMLPVRLTLEEYEHLPSVVLFLRRLVPVRKQVAELLKGVGR